MKKFTKPVNVYSTSGDLYYNGKKIDYDIPVEMQEMYFTHIYLNSGFLPGGKRTHACLHFGYWCWQDVREHPKEALKYLYRKLFL